MRVLFDTHALAWWLLDERRLSPTIRALTIDPDTEVWISSVSAFEMATKFRIGKWPDVGDLVREFESAIFAENFQLLSINASHARTGGLLESTHRDPFDRLLAAQSIIEAMPLVTSDPAFRAFGVVTVW